MQVKKTRIGIVEPIFIYIPTELKSKLQMIKRKELKTVSELIRISISEFISKYEEKNGPLQPEPRRVEHEDNTSNREGGSNTRGDLHSERDSETARPDGLASPTSSQEENIQENNLIL